MVLLRLLLLGSTEHQPFLTQTKGMTDRAIKSVSKQALRHRAAVTWLFFLIPLSYKHYLIAVPSSLWIQHPQKDLQCIARKSTQSIHVIQAHREAKNPHQSKFATFLFISCLSSQTLFLHAVWEKHKYSEKCCLSSPLGSSIFFLNHHKSFLSCRESPHAFMAVHIYTHTAWETLP